MQTLTQRTIKAKYATIYDESCTIAKVDGRFFVIEKSRWVPHSLLWGGKRAARRAATISVWPTKQVLMPFMT